MVCWPEFGGANALAAADEAECPLCGGGRQNYLNQKSLIRWLLAVSLPFSKCGIGLGNVLPTLNASSRSDDYQSPL